MTTVRHREIVVEIEKTRLIRKRSKTDIGHCDLCGKVSDFISVDEAARLFETGGGELYRLAAAAHCHFRQDPGEIAICLTSLLGIMQSRIASRTTKLIGEES